MKTVAHLSDLHFGRIDQATLAPLRRRLEELKPALVVVSGDLTQRARDRQFREARAFLDSLPQPQLVVPGNHDVPLFNVFARLFSPLGGYRKHFAAEEEPGYADEEIAVLGVNTSRSLVWKSGKVSKEQLARVRRTFQNLHRVRIVVSHHHCAALEACPADVFLSGHFHDSCATARGVIVVKAGTATSTRVRDEPNSFNVLRLEKERIEVVEQVFHGGEFVLGKCSAFVRNGRNWVPASAGMT